MRMTEAQLIAILDDIEKSVAAGDSFEGNISYSCMEEGLAPGEYEVKGSYRIGNRDGQGGYRVIPDVLNEEQAASRKAEIDAQKG